MSSAIRELVPNVTVILNKVPKLWVDKDIFVQLIPNDDANNPLFDMIPRIGAFEISTVYSGASGSQDILFFSK